MLALRSAVFRSVGGVSAHLPRMRGKNRAFLALFNALRLQSQHVCVEASLSRPIAFRARLDLHSWLQRLAFVSGEYEADTVELLVELQQSTGGDGYLLDVGANIGLIGIPAALLFQQAQPRLLPRPRVICVEAVPDNETALRYNVLLNQAQNLVSVIGTALGSEPGTADIQVEGDLGDGEGTGTANILPRGSRLDPNGTYECVRIPIQITTLDALAHSGALPANCTVVKIDTDGYDLNIIRGGRRFIASNRPVIFGEFDAHCLAWHRQGLADVIAFAKEYGYQVWPRVHGKQMRFTTQFSVATYSHDVLLVPAERADALAWCHQPAR